MEEEASIRNAQKIAASREALQSIFLQSLEDCSVSNAFHTRVRLSNDGSRTLHLDGDRDVDLTGVRRMLVIAVGKGAGTMSECLLHTLKPMADLAIEGVVIAPSAPAELPSGLRFFPGGHPLPNQASFDGARAALDLLRSHSSNAEADSTFCLFLLSGGASAMFELPLDPAITLEDVLGFHRALVHSGASITQINCVRKHFSGVKGGRLALAAGSLRCLTIAISDVPAGQLDALGSGPTLPDSSTVADCQAVLQQYNLMAQFPSAVQRFFSSPAFVETPKEVDPGHRFYLLLSDEQLAQAARLHAERLGFHVEVDRSCDDWDYKDAAAYLLEKFRALRSQHTRLCLISPGEVTVQLDTSAKSPGLGGRNQQLALYASTLFQEQDDPMVLLSVGSDGVDGNSPAAGAIVDSRLFRNEQTRSDAKNSLANFDAYSLLHSLDSTVILGPTGNNLRDLRLLLTVG